MARWTSGLLCLAVSACQCQPGVEEVCNGRDDDGDGLVDVRRDGTPLSRACPLTVGVCAGAEARCVSGKWAACEYGPDYQVTERRCDGLDNDCDGRADRSWTRELLGADAGRLPVTWNPPEVTLEGGEIVGARAFLAGADLTLVLPNELLRVASDLSVVERVMFPVHFNNRSFMFPRGGDWVRLGNDYLGGSTPCHFVHGVWSDGGFPVASDGGHVLLAESCEPNLTPYFGAVALPGGWAGVVGTYPTNESQLDMFSWLWLDADGGVSQGVLDAGPRPGNWPGTQVFSGANSLLLFWSYDRFQLWRWKPPSGELVPLVQLEVGNNCGPLSDGPLTYACPMWGGSQTRWYFQDGGLVVPPFDGYPLESVDSTVGLFAVVEARTLTVVRDGALVPLAGLEPGRHLDIRVHELGGKLVLLTWGKILGTYPDYCPVCPLERFSAEYLCVP